MAVGPKETQLMAAGDEGFEFLSGKGSERGCSKPERRIFLTQFVELIHPEVTVLRGLVEGFGCL